MIQNIIISKDMPSLYVVITTQDGDDDLKVTLQEAAATLSVEGVAGVFLVDNPGEHWLEEIIQACVKLKKEFPSKCIGFNPLSRSTENVISAMRRILIPGFPSLDALWVNKQPMMGVQNTVLKSYSGTAKRYGLQLAGGCVYKGQPGVLKTFWSGHVASGASLCDILVTSGPSDDTPPDPSKVSCLAKLAHQYDRPLVVASGVSAETIDSYMPNNQDDWPDAFFVGTTDIGKLKDLASRLV